MLIVGFSSATFRHVPRSLNEPAHRLARNCDVSSLDFISDFAPNLIQETICNSQVINKVWCSVKKINLVAKSSKCATTPVVQPQPTGLASSSRPAITADQAYALRFFFVRYD
jgi:hypothetical protein